VGRRFQTVGVDGVGVDGGRGVVQGAVGGPCFLEGDGGDGSAPSRVRCSWAATRGDVGVGGGRGNCCCQGAGNEGSLTPCRDGSGGSYW
jgi:hypothetical protein